MNQLQLLHHYMCRIFSTRHSPHTHPTCAILLPLTPTSPPPLGAFPGEPADGADGADVVIVCDPSLDTLLHLHKRKEWTGKRGAQGNPAVGSAGPKRNKNIKKATTAPLEVPVPPGTVIKRKGTGQVRMVEYVCRLVQSWGWRAGWTCSCVLRRVWWLMDNSFVRGQVHICCWTLSVQILLQSVHPPHHAHSSHTLINKARHAYWVAGDTPPPVLIAHTTTEVTPVLKRHGPHSACMYVC